jgi:hypothetical protein
VSHSASVKGDNLASILDKVRPFTMVPERSLVELARQVLAILAFDIPGDFVECGVWRGGASFLIAEVLRHAGMRGRKVWLLDSFEGLPRPEEIDGAKAMAYSRNPADPWYHDNCRASLEDVQRSVTTLGLTGMTELVKGWFDQTLPAEDDRTAISELERLRHSGARFIAFAWPAFWWLEYYDKFRLYLLQFQCVLRNDRLVLFDLGRSR